MPEYQVLSKEIVDRASLSWDFVRLVCPDGLPPETQELLSQLIKSIEQMPSQLWGESAFKESAEWNSIRQIASATLFSLEKDTTMQIESLSPVARRAWQRLEADFPMWVTQLNTRDGELEFALPAPPRSIAGHLIAFSNENQLWVRFSPPHLCYAADDENELVWLIRQLTTDEIVFKVTMKGSEWLETTLAKPQEKSETLPGHSVRFVSWSGKLDR